jgi:hypothetical protein
MRNNDKGFAWCLVATLILHPKCLLSKNDPDAPVCRPSFLWLRSVPPITLHLQTNPCLAGQSDVLAADFFSGIRK